MYNAYVYFLSCYSVISYYFVFIAVVRNVFCFPALEYLLFLEHTVIVKSQSRNGQISLHFEVQKSSIKLIGLFVKLGPNHTVKFII